MKLINQILQARRAAKLSVLALLFFTWGVVASSPARADTAFDVNAVITDTPNGPYAGDAIAGTVTINTTTGAVDAIDLYSPTSAFPTFTLIDSVCCACPGPNCVVFYDNGFDQYGELALGNTVGYTGGALGSASYIALTITDIYGTANVAYDVTGNVVAPEPGSLSLLALGMSGLLFGLYRRRLLPSL
jgi:hypothetical protein